MKWLNFLLSYTNNLLTILTMHWQETIMQAECMELSCNGVEPPMLSLT
jgi:hypothetical protein